MVLVRVDADLLDRLSGAALVTVRRADQVVAARMVGPIAGDVTDMLEWRIDGRYRIDPDGVPFADLMAADRADAAPAEPHDWGALGLPDGVRTRVRSVDEPSARDDLGTARASSGYRLGEESAWAMLAPGDRLRVGDVEGTVLAIDRRKRTLELDMKGDGRRVGFDDVAIQEAT